MTDDDLGTIAYEVEERRNGWLFRFPADDETALWRGPFNNQAAAEWAAQQAVDEFVTKSVMAQLGLN